MRFKSQIILEEGNSPSRTSKIIFRTQMRHHIIYNNRNELLKTIRDCASPSAVNGLLCDREVLAQIQNEVLTRFPSVKFRHTTKQVIDVTNYETIASDTEELIAQYPLSPAKELLQADADQILALLETLKAHHRHSRGINILGIALKYIAGTPDFEDFNEVATKEREL